MSHRTLIIVGAVGVAIILALLAAVASRHNTGASGSSETTQATAPRHDALPLHQGSAGIRVTNLQWLLGGHKPNVFTAVKGTFPYPVTGYFGARTSKAVLAYKYRIGYPKLYLKPIAGRLFFDLMLGKRKRPVEWVALAAHRVVAVVPGATALALRIRNVQLGQIGVTEYPWGSNCGTTVRLYQSVTGAYCAAWCVSFQQWSFRTGGYGTFADRTAGVFYAVGWASRRGYLRAKPKVGAIVAFTDGQGHMGFVTKVLASGYVTTEGNTTQAVRQRFHAFGERRPVYIYLPGVA